MMPTPAAVTCDLCGDPTAPWEVLTFRNDVLQGTPGGGWCSATICFDCLNRPIHDLVGALWPTPPASPHPSGYPPQYLPQYPPPYVVPGDDYPQNDNGEGYEHYGDTS